MKKVKQETLADRFFRQIYNWSMISYLLGGMLSTLFLILGFIISKDPFGPIKHFSAPLLIVGLSGIIITGAYCVIKEKIKECRKAK